MYVLVLYDPNKVLFNFFKISRNLVKCVNLSGVNLSGTTVYTAYALWYMQKKNRYEKFGQKKKYLLQIVKFKQIAY